MWLHRRAVAVRNREVSTLRTAQFYRHGLVLGTSGNHQRSGGKRGKVSGWSPGAVRRNVAFLRSVDERGLTGVGLALTLTLRHCPLTAGEWKLALAAWLERQRKGGMFRLHWVMEFQRRGVPHLHVAVWYDADRLPSADVALVASSSTYGDLLAAGAEYVQAASAALSGWLAVAKPFGAGVKGQQARPLDGPVGWFRYMAKHCGRGRQHYQRQRESLPEGWASCPRVWGHRGSWPIEEPVRGDLTRRQWFALRRWIRSVVVSRARAAVPGPGWTWADSMGLLDRSQLRGMAVAPGILGAARTSLRVRLRHLVYSRRMLKCNDRKLSEVRGVSEWVEPSVQDSLLRALASVG